MKNVIYKQAETQCTEIAQHLQSALGSDQLAWFLNDLARVNRAVTPWVTVSWHQPPVRSTGTGSL